jgi:hypothetical protein
MNEEQMSLFKYYGKNESGYVEKTFTLEEIECIYKTIELFGNYLSRGVPAKVLIQELYRINKLG